MLLKHQYFLLGLLIGGSIIYAVDHFYAGHSTEAAPSLIYDAIRPENNPVIKGYKVPEAMSFAGESVPLYRADVRERLDREIQVNAFWHSNSIILLKRAERWLPLLDSILSAHQIPTDFKYLAVAESGLDQVVSPAKAVGFWQIMKGTAGDFDLIVNKQVDQRYDPVLSTLAAIKYLKEAYQKFGNWTVVAASYNMGMSGAQKVLQNQNTTSYYDMFMSEEPSRYVFRILALKNMLENPKAFGFEVDENYVPEKVISLSVEATVTSWTEFAAAHGTTYYQLKRLNPWIRAYDLKVKKGQHFDVKIPINK